MHLWFVSPAWRRYAVTRLALAERRWLCDTLTARGIAAYCIIIADDANAQVAEEFGFPVLPMPNDHLGARFNAGFQYAAKQGADFMAAIGSDNWAHPDLFTPLLDGAGGVISGRRSFVIDLASGQGRRILANGHYGVIPWVIPTRLLEPCGYAPIKPTKTRGIDWPLARALAPKPSWMFHDPHEVARVGFKCDPNVDLTAYRPLTRTLGFGPTESDPWSLLAQHYPAELVRLAQETHAELIEEAA